MQPFSMLFISPSSQLCAGSVAAAKDAAKKGWFLAPRLGIALAGVVLAVGVCFERPLHHGEIPKSRL